MLILGFMVFLLAKRLGTEVGGIGDSPQAKDIGFSDGFEANAYA
jgi:hypothetical protein